MKLIFCICTYNRNKSLIRCLASINNLKISPKIRFKVLIVDNSLKNTSRSILKKKFKFSIIHINEKKRGIVNARNKALNKLKKIKPDYASFIDDDCTIDKYWLVNVLKIISKKKADIVTGPQIYKKIMNSKKTNLAEFFEKKFENKITKVSWAASNNVFLKYKIINNENILFDRKLNKFGIGEDQLFFSILNKKGYDIYWSKNVKVYEKIHEHRSNIKWLIDRSYKLGVLGHYIDVKLYGNLFGYLINYFKSLLYLANSIFKLFFIFDSNKKINFINLISRFYGRLVGPFKIQKIEFYKK